MKSIRWRKWHKQVWRQQNGFCVGTGVSLAVIRDKARDESR